MRSIRRILLGILSNEAIANAKRRINERANNQFVIFALSTAIHANFQDPEHPETSRIQIAFHPYWAGLRVLFSGSRAVLSLQQRLDRGRFDVRVFCPLLARAGFRHYGNTLHQFLVYRFVDFPILH